MLDSSSLWLSAGFRCTLKAVGLFTLQWSSGKVVRFVKACAVLWDDFPRVLQGQRPKGKKSWTPSNQQACIRRFWTG